MLLLCWQIVPASAQHKTRILKLDITAEIDPRMNRYVELGLDAARNGNYDLVIIEMDTYGGLVTDAKDIVEHLLNFEKPVWVFINKDAASAGALIAIACDSIYMAPGASMGAATVVMGQGEAAPDKYQSYMRATMRSTAEEKGRDPDIAEAMVDEDIEIPGVTKAGQVLTFTTSEAIEHGFCEGEVRSIEEILQRNGISDYELDNFSLSTIEKIIAFFLNPVLSGILIMIIIGGIWFELQTPGVGFPIFAAIVAAILYFIPYYLNGLAANWELVLFVVGLVLIAIELVAIPGFGVVGISGIILTISSLILVMLANDVFDFSLVPLAEIFKATVTIFGALFGTMLLLTIAGVKLTHSRLFERVALSGTLEKEAGYTAAPRQESLMGKTGTAYTVLRPAGKVMIDGDIYDAFTRGEYLEKGDAVVVINQDGPTLQVKKHEA